MGEERTFVMIKPHAVHLTHLILPMLMLPGIRLGGIVSVPYPDPDSIEEHYKEHRDRDYFNWLCDQLDGPIVVIALRGDDAVARIREIVGPTKPEDNPPTTIRGRFSDDRFDTSRQEQRAVRNVVHTADSIEAAEREIGIWFLPGELFE